MNAPTQPWYRQPYAPPLIVLAAIGLILVVLSVAQRDEAGNEPAPSPSKRTISSSIAPATESSGPP